MKTQDIQQALHAGDLDAGIIASKLEDTFLTEETLFYEQFYAYVSRKEPSFKHDVIRTSDITGEHLWLLDEGHCFRDQLVRFCQMEAVKVSQMAYRRKRKRNHFYSRTGSGSIDGRTATISTSVCYPPTDAASGAGDK